MKKENLKSERNLKVEEKMIRLSWWKKIQNKKIFKNIDKDENRNQDKNRANKV